MTWNLTPNRYQSQVKRRTTSDEDGKEGEIGFLRSLSFIEVRRLGSTSSCRDPTDPGPGGPHLFPPLTPPTPSVDS